MPTVPHRGWTSLPLRVLKLETVAHSCDLPDQVLIVGLQNLCCFNTIRVLRNAINRTDQLTLWLIEMANALCTAIRIDLENLLTFINSKVGTLRLADCAVDTVISDYQGHFNPPAAIKALNTNKRS